VKLLRNAFPVKWKFTEKLKLPETFLAEMFLRCLSPYHEGFWRVWGKQSRTRRNGGLREDMQDRAGDTEYPRSFGRVPPSAA